MLHVYMLAADSGSGGSDTPAWVAIVVALVAAVAALVTSGLAYAGTRKTAKVAEGANRVANDALNETTNQHHREEWWKRTVWAMELALTAGTGKSQRVGMLVLEWLSSSQLAHQEERNMIKAIILNVLGVP